MYFQVEQGLPFVVFSFFIAHTREKRIHGIIKQIRPPYTLLSVDETFETQSTDPIDQTHSLPLLDKDSILFLSLACATSSLLIRRTVTMETYISLGKRIHGVHICRHEVDAEGIRQRAEEEDQGHKHCSAGTVGVGGYTCQGWDTRAGFESV